MRALLCSLLLCAWALPAHAQLLSPGELARAHAELDSDDDCERCHVSGRRVETHLCVDCHADIGRQRGRGQGLHGTRFSDESCGHCHVEHRGASHELIRWPGGSQRAFDHAMTGFELKGRHAATECRKCHDERNARGAHTFLGLKQTCGSCHEDVHQGRLGERCESCHTEKGWVGARLDRFDHDDARFALRGKHRDVECRGCHHEPPQYRNLSFETCQSCHRDPHLGSLGERCDSCHSERGWGEIGMARGDHPGLRITGGHAKVACDTCHDRGLSKAPSRGDRCVACHAPVHDAPFGRDCARCHGRIRWLGLPDRLGRRVHDVTAFALEGQHGPVACDKCHSPRLPRARRFRGLDHERCGSCHEDVHRGELDWLPNSDCGSCHEVHGFLPTTFTVEAHAQVRFPLVGRHVAVPCAGCHDDPRPRHDLRIAERACADCHENPHGEQFADEMARGGCASCHNPVAWNLPNIDHGTWPLTGAHELTACASCHDATEADRRAGRGASYRGVPRECHQCHADPHLGQFRLQEPIRACDVCHTTTRFAVEDFDHAGLADYPLEGKHAETRCEGCHPTRSLRNGEEAVHYRLGYRACRDCHADPHAGGAAGGGP